MKYLTEEEKQRIRYGIMLLANDELTNKKLNQFQLQTVFRILALATPIKYLPEEGKCYIEDDK